MLSSLLGRDIALKKALPVRKHLASAATLPDLHKGAKFCLEKIFGPEEVGAFLNLTGDTNRIHSDQASAQEAGLEHPILPGILCASLFPAVLAKHFPGIIYLSQDLKFRKYAKIGEKLRVEVAVQHIRGRHVKFETLCSSSDGHVLIDGEALAKLPSANATSQGKP